MKISRLGLKEVVVKNTQTPSTTSRLILHIDLLSNKEQLESNVGYSLKLQI
jgi:hypothetical protein